MKPYVASHLKDMNRQVVYKLIRERGCTSKAELSKLTGISPPTVLKIINFLKERGLIVEVGEGETSIGRKPQMLMLNTDLMYLAAFFMEGDFLSMGIVDIMGNVRLKKCTKVKPEFDYIISMISDVFIPQLMDEAGIAMEKLFGIGIALPVIYDKKSCTIAGAPLVGDQEERDIKDTIKALEEKYNAMVIVENDANSQAIGEFVKSGSKAKDDLILISVGTGMGAGVILGGKLRRGAHNMCGEIGYMSFTENFVSDRKNPGWLEVGIGYRRIQEKFGIQLTASEIHLEEAVSFQVIDYVAPTLALCVNNIALFLDSEKAVLGGRLVEALGQPLVDRVNDYLDHHCITGIQVRMETSEDIGLIGIASMVTDKKMHEILTMDIE